MIHGTNPIMSVRSTPDEQHRQIFAKLTYITLSNYLIIGTFYFIEIGSDTIELTLTYQYFKNTHRFLAVDTIILSDR